jgi:hypothetical protein
MLNYKQFIIIVLYCMALEGTHIRFAAAFAEKLVVQNIGTYISGTVYPDSRYLTGALREATHPKDLTLETAGDDDFKKGWYMHLLCDNLTREVYFEWFGEFLSGSEIRGGNPVWVETTALKVLQDIEDVQKFSITDYLPYLDYVENPNGKDIAPIKRFNTLLQEMYADPKYLKVEHQYKMWLEWGLSEEKKDELMALCHDYQKNSVIMEKIPKVFEEMLARVKA